MTKLLIADDHQISAEGTMRLLWEEWPDIAMAETIDLTIRMLDARPVDLLVLDVEFKELYRSGFDILRHCSTHHPATRVLLLTAFDDGETARSAKRQGALGCVGKHEKSLTLVNAVRAVLAGGEWWGDLLDDPLLTPRQLLVLHLVACGRTHAAIAEHLGCAEVTIETHIRHVRERLDTPTTIEAIRKAERMGLLISGLVEDSAVRLPPR